MGTNTLVKEFVGRKDHKDYIKRGTAVENLLVEEGLQRGYTVKPSSEKQNMYDHIDLILTKGDKKFTVDVKARRTGTDKSKGFDDLWTVVEFKNTMGDSGWLYSKSDYIAFERKEDFVFADTKQLRDMCESIVDVTKRVASFKNANYGRTYSVTLSHPSMNSGNPITSSFTMPPGDNVATQGNVDKTRDED